MRVYIKRLSQKKGKETILDCLITANPHAYSVWKYKGKGLENSGKYGITVFEEKDRYTKTLSLRIGNLEDSDFGNYTCFAENALGSDQVTMILNGMQTFLKECHVASFFLLPLYVLLKRARLMVAVYCHVELNL